MVPVYQKDGTEIKKLVHESVMKVQQMVSPETLPLIEETLLKIGMENLTLCEAMEISKEVVEEFYEQGYHFFQGGKFKDALTIFNLLELFTGGSDPRITFAIPACYHHMKKYTEAAGYYMIYEALHPDEPLSYYHLYDCFKKMNQPLLAYNALIQAKNLVEKEAKYEDLKIKINVELNHLKTLENGVQKNNKASVA